MRRAPAVYQLPLGKLALFLLAEKRPRCLRQSLRVTNPEGRVFLILEENMQAGRTVRMLNEPVGVKLWN